MRRPALAALALAAACDQPLLLAELEIPSARATIPSQEFPSTTNPLPQNRCPGEVVQPGNSCLQQVFEFDLGDEYRDLVDEAQSAELRLTELSMTLVAGLGDFGDVERVVIGVEGGASGLPSVDLASYVRSPDDPAPSTITVRAASNVDLGPYVEAGVMGILARLEFGRDIPAFTADVRSTFYVRVLVDWGSKL
jgi:hypothetical protein